MRRLGGGFNRRRILGSVSFDIGGKRIIYVVNSSKSNGSALLHYVGLLRGPATKRVVCGNRGILSSGRSVFGCHDGLKVMFRRFGLFGGLSILRGYAMKPIGVLGGSRRRTRGVTVNCLRRIKVNGFVGTGPRRLSNNRGRHITVTHTLAVRPSTLLFSRPASTLSPRVINRMLGIVGSLTGDNLAVVIIARRVRFTERISSHIVFVSRNIVLRRKTPRRVFCRPGRSQAGRFLRECLAG